MIRNAVELTERWAALTGEPLKETRQRVRVLRTAGLLPDARIERGSLTDLQVARFIVASLASGTQDGAPAAARRYCELPLHEDSAHEPTTPLSGKRLGDALTELVGQARERSRWRLLTAEFNQTRPVVVLRVYGNDLDPDERATLAYADETRPGEMTPPLETIARFDGKLLRALVLGPADRSWPHMRQAPAAGGANNNPAKGT